MENSSRQILWHAELDRSPRLQAQDEVLSTKQSYMPSMNHCTDNTAKSLEGLAEQHWIRLNDSVCDTCETRRLSARKMPNFMLTPKSES